MGGRMGRSAKAVGGAVAAAEVRYRVDAMDRLVAFDDPWDAFAIANGAPELAGGAVTGWKLWAFIAEADTRSLHKALLARVRADGAVTALPFRCDSPELRRFMEMDLVPLADGAVEYRCRTLRTEARAPVAALDPARRGQPEAFIRMCSWCKQVEVAPGRWDEVEAAIRHLRLFDETPPPGVTHGICDTCQTRYFPGSERSA